MIHGGRPKRWAAIGLMACLSACGSSRQHLAPGVVAAPPEGIDGQYRGIQRLVRAAIAGCPRSGRRTVNIEGNALSLVYRGARTSYPLVATVNPDGAVHGSDGRGTIEGQISGRHLDLTVSSEFCDVRLALERV